MYIGLIPVSKHNVYFIYYCSIYTYIWRRDVRSNIVKTSQDTSRQKRQNIEYIIFTLSGYLLNVGYFRRLIRQGSSIEPTNWTLRTY